MAPQPPETPTPTAPEPGICARSATRNGTREIELVGLTPRRDHFPARAEARETASQ